MKTQLPVRRRRRKGTFLFGSDAGDPAAVQLGRKGGKARTKNLTVEEQKESARKAARARWAKKKGGGK